jgi:hypothetical protein
MFYSSGFSESAEGKREVPMNDTRPEIFWVLLLWLYGESLENAVSNKFIGQENSRDFYLDLLKAADFYGVIDLIGEVEDRIINSEYIGVSNVCDILKWSKNSNAERLRDYCKEYIVKNKNLIISKLSELRDNKNERTRISRRLDALLSDN